MTGDQGASGSQGSADPPEHLRDKDVPREMRRGSYNADAFVVREDDGTLGLTGVRPETQVEPDTQRREAKEPAPGDANPLSDPEGRPLDKRESSL